MKKLLVIDTQGGYTGDAYQRLLPGVDIDAIELSDTAGTEPHPHGAWVGWLAAIPCAAKKIPLQLTFLRIFDKNSRMVPKATALIMDAIEMVRPDAITASWGQWDGDTSIGRLSAETMWGHWARTELVPLLQTTGSVWFAAAGNDDANDPDPDIAYPQASIPEHIFIVGACDSRGVPTPWSGDGDGVSCVMWADNVASPDGQGNWTRWKGTSAAAPKLAGAYLAHECDTFDEFKGIISTLPEHYRPAGYDGKLPHPKWGYGCAEDFWQWPVGDAPSELMPPRAVGAPLYHDVRPM